MRLFPIYIFSIVLSFIFTACRKTNDTTDYEKIVTQAEYLFYSNPDSAIHLLRSIDFDNIDDNQLAARARYLYGSYKLSMLDYRSSMRELLRAEKQAETAKDYSLLKDIRKKIANIYDDLYSNSGQAKYALKIADAYELLNEPDSAFEMLYEALHLHLVSDNMSKVSEIYHHMEDIFEQCNDSNSILILNVAKAYSCDTIGSPKFFNEKRLSDSIRLNGDWRDLIKCDTLVCLPGEIYSVAADLWDESNDTLAKQLLEFYCEYYICKESSGGDYSLVSLNKVIDVPFTFNAIVLDRRNFFKKYLPLVEREAVEFYYKENVIKEQAIRYQRIKTTAIILCAGILICLLAMSLFIVRSRKRRIEEESMRSVIELKSALSQSKDRWLSTLGQLCNTYYSAYAKTATRSRTAQEALAEIESATASPTFFPELEGRLNRENDNLMARFRTAMPDLRPDEYRLFLLNALGFSIPTISLLLKEKREVIYNRRQRLRSKIQESDITDNAPFLDCLE